MFIVPLSSNINTDRINSLSKSEKSAETTGDSTGLGFKDVFQEVINNVEQTEATTEMDAYKLSIGEMDDTHTMIIDAAKAEVALQTMVQLRNKFLDAYSEVMRTNL